MAQPVAETRREGIVLHRPDGGVLVLGRVDDPRPRSRRPRPARAGRLDLRNKLTATEHDWALAGISGLLVVGVIFFVFGMATWLFTDLGSAWTYWLLGFGSWVLALGVFFSFMDNPYPKHRRYR